MQIIDTTLFDSLNLSLKKGFTLQEHKALWFVLAGLILGFALSTLWEWLYFRRARLTLNGERVAELEEVVHQQNRVRQVDLAVVIHVDPPSAAEVAGISGAVRRLEFDDVALVVDRGDELLEPALHGQVGFDDRVVDDVGLRVAIHTDDDHHDVRTRSAVAVTRLAIRCQGRDGHDDCQETDHQAGQKCLAHCCSLHLHAAALTTDRTMTDPSERARNES